VTHMFEHSPPHNSKPDNSCFDRHIYPLLFPQITIARAISAFGVELNLFSRSNGLAKQALPRPSK